MQFFFNMFFQYVFVAALAVTFFIFFKPTKLFHLAHAIPVLIGAYSSLFLIEALHINTLLALVAACGLGVISGLVFLILYGRIGGGRQRPILILVFSLGLLIISENFIAMYFGEQIRRTDICSFCDVKLLANNAISISYGQIFIVGINLLVIFAAVFIWYGTKLGLQARAISENESLVNFIGYSSKQIIRKLAMISSGLAALVGVLIMFDSGITPSKGLSILMPAVIAVIIGGGRTIIGVLLGAAFVVCIDSISTYYIGSKWADPILYSMLAIVLIFKPTGFSLNRLSDKVV